MTGAPELPEPPDEAKLIRRLREAPPHMSGHEASRRAGISEARWRQIESGIRWFRGVAYAESGPKKTVAKMAQVVGATPGQLTRAGRPDAAGELKALLRDDLTWRRTHRQAEDAERHLDELGGKKADEEQDERLSG
jgi:Helix-turn-helix domain